jgi:ferrous iron transport protein A
MTLSDLNINDKAEIAKIDGDEDKLRRLTELGIHPGRTIQVLQKTPFHGPIVIAVEQTFIALRSEEAQCIQLKMN